MADVSFRTEIRDAVIEALAPLAFSVGGYLQAIATIGQPISGDNEMAHITSVLNGRSPAVLIAIGDESISGAAMQAPMRRWESELTVHAYLIGASHRSREAGRLTADAAAMIAPSADPGLDVMAEHVEFLLAGYKPKIIGASSLRPYRHRHIFVDDLGTIREYVFQLVVNRQLAALDDNRRMNFITEIQGTYSVARINAPAISIQNITKLV